jgi:hypothetical protein
MIIFLKSKLLNQPIFVKLLKFSIFLTFILSLLGAGLTFYLSNVRENEKEKRLYLEGVRTKLEGDVQNLQTEVQKLVSENQELQRKFQEEQDAKEQILSLVQDRDFMLKRLEQEAQSARQAYQDAQSRNQELERILDDLEARMQEMEAQRTLTSSDVGMVSLQMIPPSDPPFVPQPTLDEITPPEPAPKPESEETSTPETMSSAFVVTPVTEAPKPPKKRKFLGLFGSSKPDKKEPENSEKKIETEEAVQEPAFVKSNSEMVPIALTEEERQPHPVPVSPKSLESAPAPERIEPRSEPLRTNQQTIAAGNVLLINRVHNFAVINLGSRHGLTLNDILHIQRDGAEIAKVRVEKLYEDYCAAYIVEEQSGKPIQEGDVAGIA